MTLRTIFGRNRIRYLPVEGTSDGTALSLVLYGGDFPPLLPIPDLLAAKNQSSVRHISGGTQSPNSTTRNYAHGVVKEQAIPVSRSVGVYRRDTLELLASTTSGANGYFWVSWAGYSGKVTIVVFEADGSGYNGKILDLVISN